MLSMVVYDSFQKDVKCVTAVTGDYSEGKWKNYLLIFGHVVKVCIIYILNCQIFINTFQSIYSIFFF
jgi:hypothetical protein